MAVLPRASRSSCSFTAAAWTRTRFSLSLSLSPFVLVACHPPTVSDSFFFRWGCLLAADQGGPPRVLFPVPSRGSRRAGGPVLRIQHQPAAQAAQDVPVRIGRIELLQRQERLFLPFPCRFPSPQAQFCSPLFISQTRARAHTRTRTHIQQKNAHAHASPSVFMFARHIIWNHRDWLHRILGLW